MKKRVFWAMVIAIIGILSVVNVYSAAQASVRAEGLEMMVDETSTRIEDLKNSYAAENAELMAENEALKQEIARLQVKIEEIQLEKEELESKVMQLEFVVGQEIITDFEELWTLLKIVQCEAGTQSLEGRAAVAEVVLNRVRDKRFPNTITEVVHAKGQFQPVSSGSFEKLKSVSSTTFEAVMLALNGSNYSNGALYFYNPAASSKGAVTWFDTLETTAEIGAHRFKVN